MSTTEGSGASRAGGEGFHNEDAFVVEEGLGLYLVCDGASGTPAGEIASRVAARAVEEFVELAEARVDVRSGDVAHAVVERAMVHAMNAVADAERIEPELEGLATTVTMLLASGRVGVIGHRGDSRAYLVRRERVEQLTRDHELTRSNGDPGPEDQGFDVFGLELETGDAVVLCTDGAEEVVTDSAIVRSAGEIAPRVLASRIVSAANRRKPDQDATVVVVRVRGQRESVWHEISTPPRRTAFGHTLQPV
jgi:protein phosphatase